MEKKYIRNNYTCTIDDGILTIKNTDSDARYEIYKTIVCDGRTPDIAVIFEINYDVDALYDEDVLYPDEDVLVNWFYGISNMDDNKYDSFVEICDDAIEIIKDYERKEDK